MSKLIDLTGTRFGKLTVIEHAGMNASSHPKHQWKCLCDCGHSHTTTGENLRAGKTKSCGCSAGKTVHGHLRLVDGARRQSPTYSTWQGMTQRCCYRSHSAYPRYGGKGVTICDEWKGTTGFINFLADMGERPEGMTLDRIDNKKGYSPDNCRWATSQQQFENKRVVRDAQGKFS